VTILAWLCSTQNQKPWLLTYIPNPSPTLLVGPMLATWCILEHLRLYSKRRKLPTPQFRGGVPLPRRMSAKAQRRQEWEQKAQLANAGVATTKETRAETSEPEKSEVEQSAVEPAAPAGNGTDSRPDESTQTSAVRGTDLGEALKHSRILVQACCERAHRLSMRTKHTTGCGFVNITQDEGFATPEGVQLACAGLRGPEDAVWLAPPCTGESSWQRLNIVRHPHLLDKLQKDRGLFLRLFRPFRKVVKHTRRVGAQV